MKRRLALRGILITSNNFLTKFLTNSLTVRKSNSHRINTTKSTFIFNKYMSPNIVTVLWVEQSPSVTYYL